ncbi:hypothetical protein Hanom_Chr05g00432261 [Helianthus anomalus]
MSHTFCNLFSTVFRVLFLYFCFQALARPLTPFKKKKYKIKTLLWYKTRIAYGLGLLLSIRCMI